MHTSHFVGERVELEIFDGLVTEKNVAKGVNREPVCLWRYGLGVVVLEDFENNTTFK